MPPEGIRLLEPAASMFDRTIARIVAFCVRWRWPVLGIAMLLTAGSIWLTIEKFSINTDTATLIDARVPWRANEIAFDAAFPQRTGLIVAVVEAETAERAEDVAAGLVAALRDEPSIRSLRRPDAGPFFDRQGLLLLSMAELKKTTSGLVSRQAFLGPLAADPTLRGLMETLSLGLMGIRQGEAKLDELMRPMQALADTFEAVLAERNAQLSWRDLIGNDAPATQSHKRFVLAQPALDFSALQPAAIPIARMRAAIAGLNLEADGARVRLTGSAPLADDEFATVAEGAAINLVGTLLAVAALLFVALRSWKIIASVLLTLLAGLAITAGLGLTTVGELNLISVAFAVLFVGLGVDFGIQLAIRYRAERHEPGSFPARPGGAGPDVANALERAALAIGGSLALAAVSNLAGFFSFLPTAFRGVSELGLIAGMGMVVAFLASITLMPALIAIFRPGGEPDPVGYGALAAVDHWIERNRKGILVATALIVGGGLPLFLTIPFDANPMNLRNRGIESVSTFLDLNRDPETAANTIDVLVPSLDGARALSRRLEALPEVARTVSLATFLPEDQEQKLEIVQDTAFLLDAALNPSEVRSAPTDAETLAALGMMAAELDAMLASATPGQAATMRRLAASLKRLAAGPAEPRKKAGHATMDGFTRLMDRLRQLMTPEPITLDSLPQDLLADWRTSDGRVRIEAFPKGDANDTDLLRRFDAAVRALAPDATGTPVTIVESGRTVVRAFIEAGIFALLAVSAILFIALRNLKDVALTLGPLLVAGIMTLETAALIGLPLNFANIIALPLMFGVGVAFHIYYIVAWRSGDAEMLASSLTRAILFSALTTGVAFGSLCLSSHPGTASMGTLLAISLVYTLLAAFVIVPAVLGPPRRAVQAKAAA